MDQNQIVPIGGELVPTQKIAAIGEEVGALPAPPLTRSRTGALYDQTAANQPGPIDHFVSTLVSDLNPLHIIAGATKLLYNAVTDPAAAGRQVVEGVSAPIDAALQGDFATAAGHVAAMAVLPAMTKAEGRALAAIPRPTSVSGVVDAITTAAKLGRAPQAFVAKLVLDELERRTKVPIQTAGGPAPILKPAGSPPLNDVLTDALNANRTEPMPTRVDLHAQTPEYPQAAADTMRTLADRQAARAAAPVTKPTLVVSNPPPAAAVPSQAAALADLTQAVKSAAKPKARATMNADEMNAGLELMKQGKTADQAAAILVQLRSMPTSWRNLPSDAQVASAVAHRNATGKWD